MSLKSSVLSTKCRKAIYGIVALCLLSLLVAGVIANADTTTSTAKSPVTIGEAPPTPIPTPSTTSIPVSSPSPGPSPVSSPSPSPNPNPSPSATPRNLALYENAGTITLGTTDAAIQAALTQTRAFILRKWNARQLGRLAFVSMSPTNRPFTRNFYIERNALGEWQVTLEIADTDPQEFSFVEEIGVAANGHPILEPSRPGSPPAVTRALHLKNSATVRNGLVL
ncbi:MAG: hypothetical protein ABL999_14185 [Pyrinomonadaceae bacterium]